MNMKKIYIIIVLVSFIAISCQKDGDPKTVKYVITGLADTYDVVYMDDEGMSKSKKVTPSGLTDRWVVSYSMKQGSPVYLYLKFKEDISSNMNFNMGVLINGKYHYQAKYYEKNTGDSIFEVKRAGIVPFD